MTKKIVFVLLLFLLNLVLPNNIRAEETIGDLLHQMKTESEEILSFLEERVKELESTLNKEKAEYKEKEDAIDYFQILEDVTVNTELGSVLKNHVVSTKATFGMMKYAKEEYIKKIAYNIDGASGFIRNAAKYHAFAIIMEYLVEMDFFDDEELLRRSLDNDLKPLKKFNNDIKEIKKNW